LALFAKARRLTGFAVGPLRLGRNADSTRQRRFRARLLDGGQLGSGLITVESPLAR
jgi:hypothetical protein